LRGHWVGARHCLACGRFVGAAGFPGCRSRRRSSGPLDDFADSAPDRPRERAEATADSRERVQFGTLDAPTLRHRHATRPRGCRAGVSAAISLLRALTYEAVAPIWNRSRCPTPARGSVITAEASV